MGKQCVICGGSIQNGRCSQCGMPYRKDEELYHLNEDRTEHMRHATAEAREILRRGTIPQSQTNTLPKNAARPVVEKVSKSSVVETERKRIKDEKAKKNKLIWWIIVLVILFYVLPGLSSILEELAYFLS